MIRFKRGRDGNDTNILAGRSRKALGLPKNVGWNVPVPGFLLDSPAWIVLSHRALKVISAVMAEHARNGGKENGNLVVPYAELVSRGVRRSSIRRAIAELEAVGLLAVPERGRRSYGEFRTPSRYRLTWLGTPDCIGPTNEWLAVKSIEEAETRVQNALTRLVERRNRQTAAPPSSPRSKRVVALA